MNHTMTVYNPDGSRYFHTDTVSPERETREENFWVVQGYVVVFTESAAAQAQGDPVAKTHTGTGTIECNPSNALAHVADPAPEFWDTP